MRVHLLFIGNKFFYNTSLQEYIIRKIRQKSDFIDSITYFKESDNSLFLYLEKELNSSDKLIIITTKHNFSTIGKLICTVTSDNQVLKENMLIPSNSSVFEDSSYLVEYKNSITDAGSLKFKAKNIDCLISSFRYGSVCFPLGAGQPGQTRRRRAVRGVHPRLAQAAQPHLRGAGADDRRGGQD